jgi:outer membrane protein insertion porin family
MNELTESRSFTSPSLIRVAPLLSVLLCFLFPRFVSAQGGAPKIGAVRVKGLAHFKEAQVFPILKISAGAPFSQAALDAATQALGDTGAFEEVRYSYRPENGAVAVDFLVKEAAKFRRCLFDNFPFASSAQIVAFVQRQVPLFDGSAPDTGSILDDVDTALVNFAKSRGISATVQHMRYTKLGSGDLESVFRLSGPAIRISSVHFSGGQAIAESALIREAQPLLGRDFSVVNCREFGANVFLPYYTERGFLKVKLADATGEVLQPAGGADSFNVQVNYPVAEGSVYVWDGAQWQGNQTLSPDQLTALLQLKPGDIANSKKIESSWEAIAKEYGKHGYIRLLLRPAPVFDDAARKVQFHAQIVEGDQYRMGLFSAQGFPAGAAEKLQSRWKLKPGDVFDASYANEFVSKEVGAFIPRSGSKPARVTTPESVDTVQHTVSVTLRLE